MAKRPGSVNLKRRIPKLCHTTTRGIGWHVNYRDPETGIARKHRFDVETEAEAKVAYTKWLTRHLAGDSAPDGAQLVRRVTVRGGVAAAPGSLLEVATGVLRLIEASVRKEGAPRARGTIARPVFVDREKHIKDFLGFINKRHGKGTVAHMRVEDLPMTDVEMFNRHLVDKGYSASQVGKRMQMVKRIIDRAGMRARSVRQQRQRRSAWDFGAPRSCVRRLFVPLGQSVCSRHRRTCRRLHRRAVRSGMCSARAAVFSWRTARRCSRAEIKWEMSA